MTVGNEAIGAPSSRTEQFGHESRAAGHEARALELWRHMLTCTTQIESEIRRRLASRFDISVARFDYLAQLHRERQGLGMKALSRRLMVTGGNVTGLTDELEREGLVLRGSSPADRRVRIVRLTTAGCRAFEAMAQEHEQWLLELFANLDARTINQLHDRLGMLRAHLCRPQSADEGTSWKQSAATRARLSRANC